MIDMIFRGERIYLVNPLNRVTAETIYEYFQDIDQIRYLSSVPMPYLLKDAEDFLHYLNVVDGEGSSVELGIFDKKTDSFIGMVALESIDHEVGKCELGYWVAKEYWGQGYGREAAQLVLDHAFNTLGLQKVVAYLVKENENSLGLLKRLGFQVEGLLRRDTLNKGSLVDRYVCGLLKEDWKG